MSIETLRQRLKELNRQIAAGIKKSEVNLTRQNGRAEADSLFLYAIVGGKDVGKTSIINHLADATISKDSTIVDEGTRVTVAYCHLKDLGALQDRLGKLSNNRVIFATHDRSELQNVVLMDMPDYDSRFISHLADVKQLTPYLQGLIWVITPRKYGDDEFLQQLAGIAQSHENYFIIVNKMDQIGAKAPLETVRREVFRFISNECAKRGIREPKMDRIFLLSAIEPEKYEFKQMHKRLIRPHTAQEIAQAKINNLKAEFQQNLKRINEAYHLDHHLDQMDRALDFINKRISEQFSESYLVTVSRRLGVQQSVQRRICKAVFSQRVKSWPILRTLFYPLTGIISALAGKLSFQSSMDQDTQGPQDMLRYKGKSAVSYLFKIRDGLLSKFPDLSQIAGQEPDYNQGITQSFTDLLKEYEQRITDALIIAKARPGFLKRGLIYLPLVWFPFLQPLLIRINTLDWPASASAPANIKTLTVFLISLLGSGSLLTSLAFLGLFYSLLLMIMYTRVAKAVQKQGYTHIQDLWYAKFLSSLETMLTQPLMDQRAMLAEQKTQLAQIEKELKNAVASN
ncbi:MAG: GTPase domain-containing protein [Desulfobacteraceae bacterium]|nr:GTPase domain-containing protein [Desulfobacteraceae bacterium]